MRPAIRRLAALVSCLGLLSSLPVSSALAASITVNSLTDVAANDGMCTLREAITAANTDTASGAAAGECAAGSGADTISFGVAGTITLTAALPFISSAVSIDGAGVITVSGASTHQPFTIQLATVSLSGLTVTGGVAAIDGGGILNDGGTLTVTNSTISGNTASIAGGGIRSNGTLVVTNSTISGNTAGLSGGGILNGADSTLTVTNSTISGNTAGIVGGGIRNLFGTLTVTNSTISGNTASTAGGGIEAVGASSTETVVNTIVAGNAAPAGPDIEGAVETITTSVNGVPGGKTLADILVPGGLADNGGPTNTIALALVAGNPAIDAGTSSVCAAAPVSALDQRGMPRPAACDIGAYEAQRPTIAAHADVKVVVSPPAPTVVTYTKPAGTDEQGGVLAVSCTPPSGSTFAVGTTTVTCTATDAVGHTASDSFQVIVTAVAAPTPPAPSLPNGATWDPRNTTPSGVGWLLDVFGLVFLLSLVALWRVTAEVRDKRL